MNSQQIVNKFRSALGGFNRQDVLEYISKTDAGHRKQVEALEKELSAVKAARDELDGALQGMRRESDSVAAEQARARASLEESTRSLSKVRGELSQAESKLAVAKQELSRFKAQVAELEPLAQNYSELKERIAVIELEAHKRAQEIVDAGQAEADGIRQESRTWLEGILGQYDALRGSVDELDARLQDACRLSDALKAGDEAAARLREWGGAAEEARE